MRLSRQNGSHRGGATAGKIKSAANTKRVLVELDAAVLVQFLKTGVEDLAPPLPLMLSKGTDRKQKDLSVISSMQGFNS